MNQAKIQFSSGENGNGGAGEDGIYHNIKGDWRIGSGEMALVSDPAWILAKNTIMKKAVGLFAGLAGEMTAAWKGPGWPDGMMEAGPKISKGENYRGLPWVVLDHPRLFTKRDIFAIRTLFWWGNYFSVTLHLKGIYRERWIGAIRRNIPLLAENGFHICISEEEWRHELSADNYLALMEAGPGKWEEWLDRRAFLKLSSKMDIGRWNEAPEYLLRLYALLSGVLAS